MKLRKKGNQIANPDPPILPRYMHLNLIVCGLPLRHSTTDVLEKGVSGWVHSSTTRSVCFSGAVMLPNIAKVILTCRTWGVSREHRFLIKLYCTVFAARTEL